MFLNFGDAGNAVMSRTEVLPFYPKKGMNFLFCKAMEADPVTEVYFDIERGVLVAWVEGETCRGDQPKEERAEQLAESIKCWREEGWYQVGG